MKKEEIEKIVEDKICTALDVATKQIKEEENITMQDLHNIMSFIGYLVSFFGVIYVMVKIVSL